jgi:hypothetical protein
MFLTSCTSTRSVGCIMSQIDGGRIGLAFLFKDLITRLVLEKALYCAMVAAIFFAAVPACAADAPGANPAACAQAYSDFDDKSRMLQAKFELWNYGSTRVMAVHPDGAYAGKNKQDFQKGTLWIR